jgi:potassium-dependent mechanosensitive channel
LLFNLTGWGLHHLKKYATLFYSALLVLFFCNAYARANTSDELNITQAYAQLKNISQQLKAKTIQYDDLEKTSDIIENLKKQAESCTKQSKQELSQLDALSDNSTGNTTSAIVSKTDFLEQKEAELKETISNCNLLYYEAKKLQKAITLAADHNNLAYNFSKTLPLWEVPDKTSLFNLPHYNLSLLYQLTGTSNIPLDRFFYELLMQILLGIFIAYMLYRVWTYFFKKKKLAALLFKPLRIYLPLIWFFSIVELSLENLLKNISPTPLIINLVQYTNAFFIVLLFIQINQILFAYKKKPPRQRLIQRISTGATLLLIMLSISSLIQLFSPSATLTAASISLYNILYLSLLSVVFLWLLRTALQLALKYKRCTPLKQQLIEGTNSLVFLSLIIAATLGYSAATLFITEHIIKTYFLAFIFLETIIVIWTYARILNDNTDPLSIRFHQWVGLKPNQSPVEVSVLKFLLVLAVIRLFAHFFLILWKLPDYFLSNILDYLKNDIYLFDLHINLIGVLRGLAVFCFIIILGRLLGAFFAHKNTAFAQKNARITIITLTNYMAFIFAVLISLMVLGINLSGFTLVASALSVGIGFGLKGIASDLISGLILLLSKPLRPGDHIEIKGTEGFISKIRLLSTEIKTLSESNVILPNSSLLSQSVTNYTYKNKLTRTTTYIMLKDIADVKRTKALMLAVAKRHPDVHQEKKKKPEVMVDLRPDKSAMHIVLTLWCIIKDADDRYRINSDINAKVLAAVEKAEIPLKL